MSGSSAEPHAEQKRSTPIVQDRQAFFTILRFSCLSLAFVFVLDAAIFHSTLYTPYLEPKSSTGSYEGTFQAERDRLLLSGTHHVLVFGDSRIAEGFSARWAQEAAGAGWEFSSVANPGALPRAWYYMLRDLDPMASRYDVIVLPLPEYADKDDRETKANRASDVNWLIVRLRLSDVFSFPLTYADPWLRIRAFRSILFKGLILRRDVREFVADPRERLREIARYRTAQRQNYQGRPGDLVSLQVDRATGGLDGPPGLSPEVQESLKRRVKAYRVPQRGAERAYRREWLGRMIAHYHGTAARIVIFRLPAAPSPATPLSAIPGESFVEEASRNPQVTLLDPHLFDDLERPELFFDVQHLNAKGRAILTKRLTRAVRQSLGDSPRPD